MRCCIWCGLPESPGPSVSCPAECQWRHDGPVSLWWRPGSEPAAHLGHRRGMNNTQTHSRYNSNTPHLLRYTPGLWSPPKDVMTCVIWVVKQRCLFFCILWRESRYTFTFYQLFSMFFWGGGGASFLLTTSLVFIYVRQWDGICRSRLFSAHFI